MPLVPLGADVAAADVLLPPPLTKIDFVWLFFALLLIYDFVCLVDWARSCIFTELER